MLMLRNGFLDLLLLGGRRKHLRIENVYLLTQDLLDLLDVLTERSLGLHVLWRGNRFLLPDLEFEFILPEHLRTLG